MLNMVTDSWIPACGVWVGDYPYLDRAAFREFVSTIEPVARRESSTTKSSSLGPQPILNEDSPRLSVQPSRTSRRQFDDRNRSREKTSDEIYSDENESDAYSDSAPNRFREEGVAPSQESSATESFRNGEASAAIDWEVYFEEKEAFSSDDAIRDESFDTDETVSRDDDDVIQPKSKRLANGVNRIQMQSQRRSAAPRRPP